MKTAKPTLDEIAAKISAHLKRFQADQVINKADPKYQTVPYYGANAWRVGSYVRVIYVSYQGGTSLKRRDAERYLAWLDAGNVGRHWDEELRAYRR